MMESSFLSALPAFHDSQISASVHEIKEAITVKKIYSGELFRLPAPQTEPVVFVRTSGQSPAKQVIGNRLESPAFFNRLLFHFPQELVFDHQCGSCHMQKHIDHRIEMSTTGSDQEGLSGSIRPGGSPTDPREE
jgi:hypothetical protein